MIENNEFAGMVSKFNDSLENLLAHWTDETAKTYNSFNENTEKLTDSISSNFNDAKSSYELLKKNYDEEKFDSMIQSLASMVEQV